MDDLKAEIRRQLSIEKLLNREVVAKISITDKDVADFYDQNRAQFNVAEPQYRIAQTGSRHAAPRSVGSQS